MNRALLGLFVASLARRRVSTALALLAIALGVALGLAVQLIHGAALDEFGRGMRELSGEADLQVSAGREGFDEQLYLVLAQRPEVAEASPALEVEARLPFNDMSLRVIGVDLFRVARVQPALIPVAAEGEDRFAALRPDTVFLSGAAREKLVGGGEQGTIALQAGTRLFELRIAGTVPGAGLGQVLAVMDIGAAQEAFGRVGRLTRIDLKLAPGVSRADARARLQPLLPPGVRLGAADDSAAEAAALSRAYRVNLTMLAAIALLTGGFLVFSTQWLAVIRRRREFALLRALGMSRTTLLRGLLVEGAVTGLAGGVAGVVLGYLIAGLAFGLIGGDLGAGYFAGIRPSLQFAPALASIYLALGVLAGIAGAWLPAREAARTAPASALKSGAGEGFGAGESRAQSPHRVALTALVLAVIAAMLPPVADMPLGGYAAVALLLAAAVLALPAATPMVIQVLTLGRSAIWRLAHGRLSAAPEQVVVAGAGVVASVALAVSMAIMVSSFRVSVDDWLSTVLPADLYVRASSSAESGFFDEQAVQRIAGMAGVGALDPVRAVNVRLIEGRPPVTVIARSVGHGWGLPLVAGTQVASSGAGEPGSVWVSEVVADLLKLQPGSALDLPLGDGVTRFQVAGIWRDYARQNGAVVVERAVYRQLTGDARVNDVAIRLATGHEGEAVAAALRGAFGEGLIEVALPGEIRAISLQIFDRTFLVTYLMEAVAIVIGLFGIATTFAALATARRGEFGMLRHLGLSRGEIGRLIAIEGALTAAVGVGVGLVAGAGIAWVLIEVINRQSFHWSMDLNVPVVALLLFASGMVALAALVARLAGARAMRQSAVLAVREDW